MNRELNIYLDIAASGRVMAHLLEPPGLGVRFESRRAMVRGLPDALRAHLDWLESHGEPVPDAQTSYRVAEEVRIAGNFQSGDDVGFYPPDADPVSPDEMGRYLRIAGYAHADLLRLVEGLSEAALDWVRNARTRPIRQIVRHVVAAELWYMNRIIDDPDVHGFPWMIQDAHEGIDVTQDMRERLRIVWPTFQAWARSLSPEMRSRVVTPSWFTERKNERWSARKMLRRCVEHCREHAQSIERILAAYQVQLRDTGIRG